MKKENTEAVVRNSFKKLCCRIRVLIRNTSSNLVHDFRTEVKKLKAILNLFSTELKDPEDLKLPRRLKDIYLLPVRSANCNCNFRKQKDIKNIRLY